MENQSDIIEYFQDRYDELDLYQKEFVSNTSSIIKTLANAGSGKTHSSILKIIDYVVNHNLDPKDLILISYTSKASKLLRERYTDFFQKALQLETIDNIKTPWISTIHSFCLNLLNNKVKEFNDKARFTILNDYKSSLVLKTILKDKLKSHFNYTGNVDMTLVYAIYYLLNDIGQTSEYGFLTTIRFNEDFSLQSISDIPDDSLDETSYYINESKFNNQNASNRDIQQSRVLTYVDRLNSLLLDNKKIQESGAHISIASVQSFLSDILIEYLRVKISSRSLSFIDILYFTMVYNRQHQNLASNYKVAIIDEAQDLDYLNFFIFKQLTDSFGCKLILVGDPKQSLYSFRYADPKILDKLEEFFPGKEVSKNYLLNNYRSNQTLVKLANLYSNSLSEYFDVEHSNSIKPKFPNAFKYKEFDNQDKEMAYITEDLHNHKQLTGNKFQSYAILARRNKTLTDFETYLVSRRIPYKLKYDSKALTNQSSFKFMYNIYSILLNSKDIESYVDLLSMFKGIGDRTLDKLKAILYSHVHDLNFNTIDSLELTKSTIKGSIIENITNTLLIPLRNFFKSPSFKLQELNTQIYNISTTQLNYLEGDDEATSRFVYNNEIDLSIFLTLNQLTKACNTMTQMYNSFNSDSFFRNMFETERFFEIYQALSSTQVDKDDNGDRDCITLSTVHGFKGLEAEIVYYCSMSSLSPFTKDQKVDDLCVIYVACTRAIKSFIATTSKQLRAIDMSLRKANQNPYFDSYLNGVKEIVAK